MRHVTASQANRDFSALLRQVAAGETVVVTSHGRPVAKLMPASADEAGQSDADRARRRAAWGLLEQRLRSQPARNLGRFDRSKLYEDEA